MDTQEAYSNSKLNALNERLLERINATGTTYLTHTRLHDRLALRIAVGNVLTEERHLAEVWTLVCEQLGKLGGEVVKC